MVAPRRRLVVLGSAAGVLLVAGLLLLRPRGGPPGAPGDGTLATTTIAMAATTTTPSGARATAAPVRETIHDRKARDELRQRIAQAWAAEGEAASAAGRPRARLEPAPTKDGEGMDPAYIQSVVRSDLWPMVGKCYEELLARVPAAKGRLELSYTILGEEDVGGLVDEVEVKAEGSVVDEELATCVKESTLSIAFRPPANGGKVTVVYPIVLAPDDPDEKK